MFLFQIRDAELRKASLEEFDLRVCKKAAQVKIEDCRILNYLLCVLSRALCCRVRLAGK